MKHADDAPALPSIFECCKPVERYRALAGAADAAADAVPRPVDAFLMSQFAVRLPSPALVFDLAADATGGATAALWATHPNVRHVVIPARGAGAAPAWRTSFAEVLAEMGVEAGRVSWTEADPDGALDALVRRHGGPPGSRRALVSLAPPDAVGGLFRSVLERLPGAVGLAFPVGPVGDGPGLECLLRCCGEAARRLVLLREASPFLAASQLALVAPPDEPAVVRFLEWLRTAYGGNFQFLSLLRTVTEQAVRLRSLEGAGGAAAGGKSRPTGWDSYGRMVERVREVADEYVPAGATVLVISKGDDNLADLGDHRGWHFPRTPDGVYAGHHPANGRSALKHLRQQVAKGAGYLLVPAPFYWWLEHYAELRAFLETKCRIVACRPETCIVYDLRPARRPAPAAERKRPQKKGVG
ncbi:MAG TPA: hypothetical protein VGF55_30630 [Gemmataceae bacterium]|jgi:hypothetical protein